MKNYYFRYYKLYTMNLKIVVQDGGKKLKSLIEFVCHLNHAPKST